MSEIIRIPSIGDTVAGRYLLTDEVGRGGFGVVFKARQNGVNRDVAIKMLLPHAMSHEGVIERFKREAHLAGSLSHSNTVKIFDTGVYKPEPNVKELPYIAMEYLEGETLQVYLHRHKMLHIDDAFDLLLQTLSSLGEAHRKGIIHRDLKPENIFICNRNVDHRVVKVLDFGIAKAIAGNWDPEAKERLTRTGFVAGTAEYMAPEQASGEKDITPALDVYAMGCLAFQMLAGKVPYTGNSPMDIAIKHISDPIPHLPPPYAGQFVELAIRRAMAKKPEHRFKDASQFAEVLRSGNLGESSFELMATDEREAVTVDDYNSSQDDSGSPTKVMASFSFPDDDTEGLPTPLPVTPAPAASRSRFILAGIVAIFFLLGVGVVLGVAGFNLFLNDDSIIDKAAAAAPVKAPQAPEDPPAAEPEPKPKSDEIVSDPVEQAPPTLAEDKVLASVVRLVSDPSSAFVYHQGKKVGVTPMDLMRPEDDTTTEIELRKRKTQKTVTIEWEGLKDGQNYPIQLRGRTNTRPTGEREKDTPPVAEKINDGGNKTNGGNKTGSGDKTNGGNKTGGEGDKQDSPDLFKPRNTPKLINGG